LGVLDGVEGLAGEELAPQGLCQRSTFPVVVGDRGAVNRCLMPFSKQIRSNNTGPGPGPNLAVKTLPLSVKIPSGTPYRRIANASASQVGFAVARATTKAETTEREWSSIPDTIFASPPSTRRTPPTMSICHNSIARDRSHRT
jgi:hypothetical protein